MPDPLTVLRKAHKARRRADSVYRAALLAAVADGHTYAEIAKELGLSRQSVRMSALRAI
ncbi:MAG: sigma-70 region 4 domain-containing protein [Gemmatimonadaceae bacterium]|nr:sigma-70 region 4 domain-containing protein [Gemmatimonadaceae bacterium]